MLISALCEYYDELAKEGKVVDVEDKHMED